MSAHHPNVSFAKFGKQMFILPLSLQIFFFRKGEDIGLFIKLVPKIL